MTFRLKRKEDNMGWEVAGDNEKPRCVFVMQDHVEGLERKMKEHYVEHNTLIGAIEPHRQLVQIDIEEDGRIRYYVDDIET